MSRRPTKPHRRGRRQPLATIVRIITGCAVAFIGSSLMAGPAQAVDLDTGHGVLRSTNVWYGSYVTGGLDHYCGDPIAGGAVWRAPTAAGGADYGEIRTSSTWTPRTSGVEAMSGANVRRMAYILSEHGATTDDVQAAHVSYAVRRLTTAGGGANGSPVPSAGTAIAEGGRALLEESRDHHGPYSIPLELHRADDARSATITGYRPVSARGTVLTGYEGSLSIDGPGEFESNASSTRPAPSDGEPVAIRAIGTGEITVSAHYEDLPSTRLHYRVPDQPRYQRVLVAGQTEPVRASASEQLIVKTSPRVATQTSDQIAEPGTTLTDRLHVTGLHPGTTVTVESTLYGPFAERPDKTPAPPADVPVVGQVETEVTADENGEAGATTEGIEITTPGYYVWFETIAADDQHHAWPGLFGQVSETTLLRWQPHVETQTSEAQVYPGAQITDALHVTGLRPGASVEIESTLYGPFDQRPDLSEHPPEGAPRVGTHMLTVTAEEDGTASVTTPPLTVDAPGYYVWHETIAADDHHSAWVAPFGQVSETTLVTEPPAPPPTPKTEEPATPHLPATGSEHASGLIALSAALLIGGGSILTLRRRFAR